MILKINEDDLQDVLVDMEGFSNLLTVVMSSEYYQSEDTGVFLALRNSVDHTKEKLEKLMEESERVHFEINEEE